MGTVYKAEKCWLMIGTMENTSGTVPRFRLLHDILLQGCGEEANIYFIVIVMDTVTYNPVLGAYEVNQLQQYKCIYRPAIGCYHTFNAIPFNGSIYIKSKYDLTVFSNYSYMYSS